MWGLTKANRFVKIYMPETNNPAWRPIMIVDIDTIVDAIYYLRSKFTGPEKVSKLKIVKLIYLADKYHLLCYGRTITNDRYCAVINGPMGSTVANVLTADTEYLTPGDKKKISELIDRNDKYNIRLKNLTHKTNMLSESDEEAIDFIFKKFGKRSVHELIDYVHLLPEWAPYGELLKSGGVKYIDIEPQGLLGVVRGDIFSKTIPKEHIKVSRKILLGEIV